MLLIIIININDANVNIIRKTLHSRRLFPFHSFFFIAGLDYNNNSLAHACETAGSH